LSLADQPQWRDARVPSCFEHRLDAVERRQLAIEQDVPTVDGRYGREVPLLCADRHDREPLAADPEAVREVVGVRTRIGHHDRSGMERRPVDRVQRPGGERPHAFAVPSQGVGERDHRVDDQRHAPGASREPCPRRIELRGIARHHGVHVRGSVPE
jgi:hypothetical protein